jgi:hypothetical protein
MDEIVDRWDMAGSCVETSRRLMDDLPRRILEAAMESRKGRLGYGNGRSTDITPTQIVRTIDEARRLLLAAKKELS